MKKDIQPFVIVFSIILGVLFVMLSASKIRLDSTLGYESKQLFLEGPFVFLVCGVLIIIGSILYFFREKLGHLISGIGWIFLLAYNISGYFFPKISAGGIHILIVALMFTVAHSFYLKKEDAEAGMEQEN